jgi:hypothetical protein
MSHRPLERVGYGGCALVASLCALLAGCSSLTNHHQTPGEFVLTSAENTVAHGSAQVTVGGDISVMGIYVPLTASGDANLASDSLEVNRSLSRYSTTR